MLKVLKSHQLQKMAFRLEMYFAFTRLLHYEKSSCDVQILKSKNELKFLGSLDGAEDFESSVVAGVFAERGKPNTAIAPEE